MSEKPARRIKFGGSAMSNALHNERLSVFVDSRAGKRTAFILTCLLWLGCSCVSSILYIGRVFPFQPFTMQWPVSLALTGIPFALLKHLEKFESEETHDNGNGIKAMEVQPDGDAGSAGLRKAKMIFALTEMLILSSLLLSVETDAFSLALGIYLVHLTSTVIAVLSPARLWSSLQLAPIKLAALINVPILVVAALVGLSAKTMS